MRILSLADIRFPLERANGIQTMETAWHLAARGHAVTLVVRPDTRAQARDPFTFYGLTPLDTLRIERARVFGPPALRRVLYLAQALAAVRRHAADVVFTRDLGVASAVLRRPRHPAVVFESHGYAPVFAGSLSELVSGAADASPRKLSRLAARERRVWTRADAYVCTTAVLRDELVARFGARADVFVIPNGFRANPRPAAPGDRPSGRVVAYAGHLYPWKGVDDLLQAIAALPDVEGLIVGGRDGDPDLARTRALAASLGIADRVVFTGLLAPADVSSRLGAAAVLVLPTVDTASARYTSPLKMFEYMAAGRPIVASDLPPVREVLTDGVNARLVPPRAPAALAAALQAMLDDPETAGRLAARARSDVARFDWRCRAERLEAVLAAACSR